MQPPNGSGKTPNQFKWSWTEIRSLLTATYKEWNDVEAPRLGASLAYYTILSLAPLLIVLVAVAGLVFGRQAAQGALVEQIQGLVGKQGAEAIQTILQEAGAKKSAGTIATLVGAITLLFGASSVAIELRSAMNKIWSFKETSGIKGLIKERSYAVAVVLGGGFLLLVSLVISTAIASLDKFFGNLLPVPAWVAEGLNVLVSLLLISGVLAAIFKYIPSVPLTWRDVSVGAVFTAILFTVGKTAIGIYLGRATVGSVYGAAGSLVVVLVWIYYSAQILFFGAEFIRVYSNQYGSKPMGDQLPAPIFAQATTEPQSIVVPAELEKSDTAAFLKSIGALIGASAALGVAIAKAFKSSDQSSGKSGA